MNICKYFLIIFIFLLIPVLVLARQGCCSHHGGVCGCSCCDGSSLSATCAPYYPECSGSGSYKSVSSKNNKSGNYNWIAWLVGLAGVGAAGYYFGKNKK